MSKLINLNNSLVSNVLFVDGVNLQRLTFVDSHNQIKPGDHVSFSIYGKRGTREFRGIATTMQRLQSSTITRKFTCTNYAQLATNEKLKYKSDYDSYDSNFSAQNLNSAYKIRFKGSGITGEVKYETMLHKVNLAMNDPAIRLTGNGIVLMHEGLPGVSNVEWLIGASFKTFFNSVLKKAYPTLEYRFDRNYIYIFDRLKSKVHKLPNSAIGVPALTLRLLNSYSNVIVESKNVDEIAETTIAVTTSTEQIPVPPFSDTDYHYSGIEFDTANGNSAGLNEDHDAYSVTITSAGNVKISGGQDTRVRVQSTKNADCKQRFGWDRDAVIIDEDLGKVENAGANNIDRTDIMQNIADREIEHLEKPLISGKLPMQYTATDIFPGQQVNLYEDPDFAPYNLYVSTVTFEQSGNCYLTIASRGASFIESSKIDLDLEEKRKEFKLQHKIIK